MEAYSPHFYGDMIMILLCFVGMFAGLALTYLTWKQQRVLAKPLSIRPWRAAGLVLMVVSVMVSVSLLPVAAAFFVWLLLMMLVITALPYIPGVLSDSARPQN